MCPSAWRSTDSAPSKRIGNLRPEATLPGSSPIICCFGIASTCKGSKGENPKKFTGDNEETFTKFDEKQWNDTVKQLDQVMTDLEKLVESADEQKLSSMATTVANICTHNGYHVGQIVYVRKLQGSWNAEKGVK